MIVGLLATGATALFPVMLYSTLTPANSLTAYAVASSPNGLFLAAIWWPVAFILAATYFIFISNHYKGKVSVRAIIRATISLFSSEAACQDSLINAVADRGFRIRKNSTLLSAT